MTRRTLLVLVAMVFLVGVIAGAVACQETPQASADSRVSDFLKVGHTYHDDFVTYNGISFTVLEIVNDSWVYADTSYGNGWINANQLIFVEEYQS